MRLRVQRLRLLGKLPLDLSAHPVGGGLGDVVLLLFVVDLVDLLAEALAAHLAAEWLYVGVLNNQKGRFFFLYMQYMHTQIQRTKTQKTNEVIEIILIKLTLDFSEFSAIIDL